MKVFVEYENYEVFQKYFVQNSLRVFRLKEREMKECFKGFNENRSKLVFKWILSVYTKHIPL